jgi:plastocyanin
MDKQRRAPVAGAIVIALVLFAACQAGAANNGSQVLPQATATDGPGAVPTATATPSPTTSPTATASGASPAPATAIDPRADGLDVAFGEFAITLEAAVIRPGPVTLVVHNAGQLTHGFEMKIEGGGSGSGSGSGSGRDRQKIETRTFHSGETLRVEADLPPGVYEIECYVANHASMGMHTTLEVRANAPLASAGSGAAVPGAARIVQFAFVPASVDLAVGSRMTWTNDDPTPHTVTADDGTFDSKQLDPGASFSVVLDKAGSYSYHCEIHPTMVGTVVVQ